MDRTGFEHWICVVKAFVYLQNKRTPAVSNFARTLLSVPAELSLTIANLSQWAFSMFTTRWAWRSVAWFAGVRPRRDLEGGWTFYWPSVTPRALRQADEKLLAATSRIHSVIRMIRYSSSWELSKCTKIYRYMYKRHLKLFWEQSLRPPYWVRDSSTLPQTPTIKNCGLTPHGSSETIFIYSGLYKCVDRFIQRTACMVGE